MPHFYATFADVYKTFCKLTLSHLYGAFADVCSSRSNLTWTHYREALTWTDSADYLAWADENNASVRATFATQVATSIQKRRSLSRRLLFFQFSMQRLSLTLTVSDFAQVLMPVAAVNVRPPVDSGRNSTVSVSRSPLETSRRATPASKSASLIGQLGRGLLQEELCPTLGSVQH